MVPTSYAHALPDAPALPFAYRLRVVGKEDDLTPLEQLPPATQTGAGTFGCLIDGQAHVIYEDGNIDYGFVAADLTSGSRSFSVQASNERANNPHEGIFFLVPDSLVKDNVVIELSPKHEDGRSALYVSTETYFRAANLLEGRVHITRFDVPGRVASGTFEMSFALDGDTVRITVGRFDLTLIL